MNPEIKSRWVAALRSGDYPQGTGQLNRNGKFCCLGVLCELAVHDGVIESLEYRDGMIGYRLPGNINGPETGILPERVTYWAGMGHPNPLMNGINGLYERLSTINDDGAPFTVIADLIEEQL